jgi:hypothetical protein
MEPSRNRLETQNTNFISKLEEISTKVPPTLENAVDPAYLTTGITKVVNVLIVGPQYEYNPHILLRMIK